MDSLEAVTALKYSLATTFPRRVYAAGGASPVRPPRCYARGAMHTQAAGGRPDARATHARRVVSAARACGRPGSRAGKDARTKLTTSVDVYPAQALPPSSRSACVASLPAAASLGQSLQELDLVPQAALLMQPEDD